MSASFNKFYSFTRQMAAGVFAGALNANTDELKVYLSATAPDPATMVSKSQLAEIPDGNGYPAGGLGISNAASESAGVITVTGDDKRVTASGGSIGPFRYAVLYDDTAAGDPLVGWWDYGQLLTLQDGESFDINFGASVIRTGL